MKTLRITHAVGHIDDDLIDGAANSSKTAKRKIWIKWTSVAACFCLLLTAVIAIPMMMDNGEMPDGTVVAKFDGEYGDSIIQTPLSGECIFFREVEEARKEYAGKDVKFLLAFDIFNNGETEITDEELKAEHQRLSDLGYKLYYVENHWTYYGKGEKKYIPIVVGLFTEEQLANFDVNEKYGYSFYFQSNGDGSPIEVDEKNTVTNFNSIVY